MQGTFNKIENKFSFVFTQPQNCFLFLAVIPVKLVFL